MKRENSPVRMCTYVPRSLLPLNSLNADPGEKPHPRKYYEVSEHQGYNGLLSLPLSEIFPFGLLSLALPPKGDQVTNLPSITFQVDSFFSAFWGAFKTNGRARVWVNIQNSAQCSPTGGLAWQWKPRATKGDQQRKTKFLMLEPSANSLQALFKTWGKLKQGLRRGSAGEGRKIIHRKSNCNMKRTKEGLEPDRWMNGIPGPLLLSSK